MHGKYKEIYRKLCVDPISLDKTAGKRYTEKAVYAEHLLLMMKFGLAQWESMNRVRLGTKQH